MTTLEDRTVLVTGANRGVGKELVTQLLERGVAKVYAGARDSSTITLDDPRVEPVELDVTDDDSVARAAGVAHDVSVVVNNAGIMDAEPLLAAGNAGLRRQLEVNLFGPLRVTTAFVDDVVQRSGTIVNVASVLSWIALGGGYSVSKAGLWAATDSLRLELAPRDVQVLGVYMGYIDTDMTEGVEAEKTSPADAVRRILDALEAGEDEVLVDETSRQVRAGLDGPVRERYAGFLPG